MIHKTNENVNRRNFKKLIFDQSQPSLWFGQRTNLVNGLAYSILPDRECDQHAGDPGIEPGPFRNYTEEINYDNLDTQR